MVQWIITVLIILAALGLAVYRIIKYFSDPIRGCDGCVKNCVGCPLEELKKEIELKNATDNRDQEVIGHKTKVIRHP